MPQRMMRKLVTATIAAGLVGWTGARSPSALADPEVPAPSGAASIRPQRGAATGSDRPRRPIRSRRRRIRSPRRPIARAAASAGRVAFPPPPRGPVPPPVDPPAPLPPHPLLPPIRWPPRSPPSIPEGTPAGQNPTPYTGAAGVRAADVQPGQRVDGGCRQADLHQLRAADRRPGDGRAGAVHISSVPPVPGKFYWTSDTQVRWRPLDFWPADTT